MAEDLLFATLDPTLRQISLPGIDKAILSDTVGFVSDLPTQLVAAFKATLEEVISADLLIHVRDIAHPDSEAQRVDVEAVLAEIGVAHTTPRIEAWNKLDLLAAHRSREPRTLSPAGRGQGEGVRRQRLISDSGPPHPNPLPVGERERAAILAEAARREDVIALSALSGEGVDRLQVAVAERLTAGRQRYTLTLDASDGAGAAWLHQHGEVLEQNVDGDHVVYEVRMAPGDIERFHKRER